MSNKVVFINVDPEETDIESKIDGLNNDISSGKQIFLFLYMDGCGPCNETKPQWKSIEDKLKTSESLNGDVTIAMINQKFFEKLINAGNEPMGYPSLRYIKEPVVEEYEESDIPDKDRTTKSFIEWIESKTSKKQNGGKKRFIHKSRKTKKRIKNQRGGKWSLKYKKSINCKKPKGFSLRHHCKYGRKMWRHN
jgi:hypothetical protein